MSRLSKTNLIKKFLPTVIFLFTIIIACLSAGISLRDISKIGERGIVGEAYADDPPCGEWRFSGRVYCQDQGKTIPMPGVRVYGSMRSFWGGGPDAGSPSGANMTTGASGEFSIHGATDIAYSKTMIEYLRVVSLPSTITLAGTITLGDGRVFPAGTQLLTAQMTGPRTVNCTSQCFSDHPVPPRSPTVGDCSNPQEYRNCVADGPNLEFLYANCFPPPPPTATPTPTPTPRNVKCDSITRSISSPVPGNTIIYGCTGIGNGLSFLQFRTIVNGGTPSDPQSGYATSGQLLNFAFTIPSNAQEIIAECRACGGWGSGECTEWGRSDQVVQLQDSEKPPPP